MRDVQKADTAEAACSALQYRMQRLDGRQLKPSMAQDIYSPAILWQVMLIHT